MEVDGQPFPFSRGCSFYTVDEQGKISTVSLLGCLAASPPFGRVLA